jgi:predicted 3-demethylubiquinone-9 3-methyltransferase (glyoxalase superfamily)
VEKNILPKEMVKWNIEYYVEVINNAEYIPALSGYDYLDKMRYSLNDALLLLKHGVDTNLIDFEDCYYILKKALSLEKDSEKREEIERFMEDLKKPLF